MAKRKTTPKKSIDYVFIVFLFWLLGTIAFYLKYIDLKVKFILDAVLIVFILSKKIMSVFKFNLMTYFKKTKRSKTNDLKHGELIIISLTFLATVAIQLINTHYTNTLSGISYGLVLMYISLFIGLLIIISLILGKMKLSSSLYWSILIFFFIFELVLIISLISAAPKAHVSGRFECPLHIQNETIDFSYINKGKIETELVITINSSIPNLTFIVDDRGTSGNIINTYVESSVDVWEQSANFRISDKLLLKSNYLIISTEFRCKNKFDCKTIRDNRKDTICKYHCDKEANCIKVKN